MSQLNSILQNHLDSDSPIIIGKKDKVLLGLTGLLAGGHLLIEDVPGVGKTTLAKYLAKIFGLRFNRIQCTNDMLPSDILGINLYDEKNQSFNFHKGPIFCELLLADELNRASAKSQSALLEGMEERKVSIDGETYDLPKPFFVIATQNPHSQIGTNPLPESQIDRFLMKLDIGHPNKEEESILLKGGDRRSLLDTFEKLSNTEELIKAQQEIQKIHLADSIIDYILELLAKSRRDDNFNSLSPRAGLDIVSSAKAYTYLMGKEFVTPNEVQFVLPSVLGHRLLRDLNASVSMGHTLAMELIQGIEAF